MTEPTPPKAGPREWTGLAVLALPVFLMSVDLTALHLALPHLTAELGADSAQQLWILDVYGFLLAGLLITMGTVGDRIGRRRLLLIGGAAFGAASLVAAYAPTAEALIAARALLGVAGATLMPSTMSLLRNMFLDDRQRAMAIGIWMSCFFAGSAAGPLIGGVLLEWFWWGSVFLMAVPVMLLLLVTGPFLLPEFRAREAGRIDPLSVLLSMAAVLPLVYGLKEAAKDGWGAGTAAAVLAAAVFGWLFVRRQHRLDAPLLDLSLFRHRVFSVGLGSVLAANALMGGFVLLLVQYLQLVEGLSPALSGAWMLPFALTTLVAALATPPVAARLGERATIIGSLLIGAAGFVLVAVAPDGPAAFAWTLAATAVVALGMTPLGVLVVTLAIGAAPKERSGSASAVTETFGEMGASLGVALMGALATAVYRTAAEGGLPPGAADGARESLPGAAAAAADLPAEAAAELMSAARESFLTGFTVIGAAGAAGALALAVLIGLFLTPPAPAPSPAEEADGARAAT
ncbi:MFS transporter [Nocardiopsis sp. CNT-189]|uniref:MFS transporter n=1 Tax=Nocardiopsis oceanisediminis TaxID=2816862 RepID=UPI003B3448F0